MPTIVNILNLANIEVLKTEVNKDDYLFTVRPTYKQKYCQKCWSEGTIHKHGSRERIIRDLNYQGKRVGIKLNHQRYKCLKCGETFYQALDFVDVDCKMTVRLRDYIIQQSLKRPFSHIADELGLSHTIVRDLFKDYVAENELKRVVVAPRVLGIDEAHLNKVMRGVFTDTEHNTIIEMTKTRAKKEVIRFMKSMCNYENIEVVTCDMWDKYIEAANETLPNAVVVIDKYHVVSKAIKALDTIRKQFKDSLNDSQRRLLMRERKVLLGNKEDLKPYQIKLRDKWFNIFPTLKEAYCLKEDFRDIYKASSRAEAEELFDIWCSCIDADMKPFLGVAKTVIDYRKEIFNYFDCRYTNAFTESFNDIIKLIEKNGRGYSFEVLRAKVLYGTRATNKPKFGEEGFNHIGNMMVWSYMHNHAQPEPIMLYTDDPENSFGVDIPTLAEVLQNGEF